MKKLGNARVNKSYWYVVYKIKDKNIVGIVENDDYDFDIIGFEDLFESQYGNGCFTFYKITTIEQYHKFLAKVEKVNSEIKKKNEEILKNTNPPKLKPGKKMSFKNNEKVVKITNKTKKNRGKK